MDHWEESRISMVADLAGDYSRIADRLAIAVEELRMAREEERLAVDALKMAQAAYDVEEASMLIMEEYKGKDGALDGRNQTIRDRQTKVFINEAHDGPLFDLWQDLQQAEERLTVTKDRKQDCVDSLSALRNVARMIAGLGHALGA
jgi:hypothetical protein